MNVNTAYSHTSRPHIQIDLIFLLTFSMCLLGLTRILMFFMTHVPHI